MRLAREIRPQVVYHAVGLPTDAVLIGLLTGAPTIVRLGGLDFKTNYVATDLQAINAEIAERCCARMARSVTFVTNGEMARKVWAGRFAAGFERFNIIPNGVDFAPLLNAEARQTMKRELFGIPDAVVVGYVGRFQNVKRPELWINVALELCDRDPRLRFLLVGDGPLAGRMQARVDAAGLGDRFRFTGALAGGLGDLYQAMDVLLHTASIESLPNALIEAIGHGTFAVAGLVGGVPEVIDAPCCGELVPSDGLAGFVACMTGVLSRTDMLERDRERRAGEIQRKFAMSRMWDGFARAFAAAARE